MSVSISHWSAYRKTEPMSDISKTDADTYVGIRDNKKNEDRHLNTKM